MSKIEQKILRLSKGINLSADPSMQPVGSYRFALNAINKTENGDPSLVSSEEGNEFCANIGEGQYVIGSDYLSNNEIAIFSTNNKGVDQIGTLKNCKYELYLKGDLGFEIGHQIDSTSRIRNGCDRLVYFVDGKNNLRYFNFDKKYLFVDPSGNGLKNNLNLIQRKMTLPKFTSIDVVQGGNLPIGSIRVGVKYSTQDGLGTRILLLSRQSNIYSSMTDDDYDKIHGDDNGFERSNMAAYHTKSHSSNKRMDIVLESLDLNFDYYQLVFFIKDGDEGFTTKALISPKIPTTRREYSFQGNESNYSLVDPKEMNFKDADIYAPSHIDQVENRLVIAGVQGKQYDVCGFQRSASAIRANYVVKSVPIDSMERGDAKAPGTPIDSMTFMADEVYPFGIVYVFEDGYETPVAYHIPGRAPNDYDLEIIDVWTENIKHLYPIEADYNDLPDDDKLKRWEVENTSKTDLMSYWESRNGNYHEKDDCNKLGFWGSDFFTNELKGEKVRHHKMPSRSQVPLVSEFDISQSTKKFLYIYNYAINENAIGCPGTVTYLSGGVLVTKDITLTKAFQSFSFYDIDQGQDISDVIINYTCVNAGNIQVFKQFKSETSVESPSGFINVIGMEFTNIIYPDDRIVGHYIVVADRDDSNRTIFDKGISAELRQNDEYITFSHFQNKSHLLTGFGLDVTPDFSSVYALYPKFCFDKDSGGIHHIHQEGKYLKNTVGHYTTSVRQDVLDGTSSTGLFYGIIKNDDDGMDWILGFRWVSYLYSNEQNAVNNFPVKKSISLKAYDNVSNYDGTKKLYNTTGDTTVQVMKLDGEYEPGETYELKYISLKTGNDVYPDPHSISYRRISPQLEVNDSVVFGGDCYISKTGFTESTYYNTAVPSRWWETISNIIAIVVIAAATIVTAGAAGVATTIFLVSTLAMTAIGITAELVTQFYKNLDGTTLRNLIFDEKIRQAIGEDGDSDDLFRYMGEHISGIYIESEIPVALRSKIGDTCGSFYSSDYSDVENLRSYFEDKYIKGDERRKKPTLPPLACPEVFMYNKDYLVGTDDLIPYFSLPSNFDCCSKCIEQFPLRIHYSEIAYTEQKDDHFATFLPNNYRDIEGNYGEISDLWTLGDKLYIHTPLMLFIQPQNYQEKVLDDVTVYIGTGAFFSLPPVKANDDDLGTMGSTDKWATKKHKGKVYFFSSYDLKVYVVSAKGSGAISDAGIEDWLYEHGPLKLNAYYERDTGKGDYPLTSNPANPDGVGYHAVIDERYDRYIITKRDFSVNVGTFTKDMLECKGHWLYFENLEYTLRDYDRRGWKYNGLDENCNLEFIKPEKVNVIESSERLADVHLIQDYSGSFAQGDIDLIKDVVDEWKDINLHPDSLVVQYTQAEIDSIGTGPVSNNKRERFLRMIQLIKLYYGSGDEWKGQDVIMVVFINESSTAYYPSATQLAPYSSKYEDDYNDFKDFYYDLGSFNGIIYPFATGSFHSDSFIFNTIAAVEGVDLTAVELNNKYNKNGTITQPLWDQFAIDIGNNPYKNLGHGLKEFNWIIKEEKTNQLNPLFTVEEFSEDVKLSITLRAKLDDLNIQINDIIEKKY